MSHDLLAHLLSRLEHGATRDIGCARRIGAGVEGSEISVTAVNKDLVERHTQRLGSDLGQDGIRASAQVSRADKQIETAVVIQLDGRGPHIKTSNACAVHADGKANAALDMRALRVILPGWIVAALPSDRLLPAATHSSSPFDRTIWAKPSRPSPIASASGRFWPTLPSCDV